jgi:DNA-directed RNA polymerase sigma subunit (sigma70/sigma32)
MQQDANEKLFLCLSCLTEREKLIVVRYYGLDNQEPISLSKIASMITHKTAKDQRITRERVRQIKARAITKMRLRSGQINSARCNVRGNMHMEMPTNSSVPVQLLPRESQLAFA